MDPFLRLQELLKQNQFELLLPEKKEKNMVQDVRLVYQMNDAVESFLVFRDASWTGMYDETYEGELRSEFHLEGERKILGVWQGDSVLTLFYRRLDFEVHLYNYGDVAHFWVPCYENLRQLEMRIAILWDKYTYLGEEYCTEGEKQLVALANVPVLNFCSFCAVPPQYMVPHEIEKESFLQGLAVMEQFAVQAGDRSLVHGIRVYRKYPNRFLMKWLACKLSMSAHFEFVRLLTETIKKETAGYPYRSFGSEADQMYEQQLQLAQKECDRLQKAGAYAEVLREEPFLIGAADMERKVYVMATWINKRKQRMEILEYR